MTVRFFLIMGSMIAGIARCDALDAADHDAPGTQGEARKREELRRRWHAQTKVVPPQARQSKERPSPIYCCAKYLKAARQATSLSSLKWYLPSAEFESLERQQKVFDPSRVAANRAWHKKHNPALTEELLDHLTQSPFAGALKRHRSIAKRVLNIRGMQVAGDKAKVYVTVERDVTINGIPYNRSSGTVHMKWEDNYWRVTRYNDSNLVYRSRR